MYSQGIHYHYEQNSFVPVHKNLNKRMKLYLTEFFLSSTISFLGKGKLFSVASAANFFATRLLTPTHKNSSNSGKTLDSTKLKELFPLSHTFWPFKVINRIPRVSAEKFKKNLCIFMAQSLRKQNFASPVTLQYLLHSSDYHFCKSFFFCL